MRPLRLAGGLRRGALLLAAAVLLRAARAGWASLAGLGADADMADECRPFLDHQLGSRQIALIARGGFQLDAIAGGEVSLHVAFDDDRAGIHVRRHLGLLGHMLSLIHIY